MEGLDDHKIVIILISLGILFIFFCISGCEENKNSIINPYISSFFGGLDLELNHSEIRKIDKGLEPGSGDQCYSGRSRNNPNLYISAYLGEGPYLTSIFWPTGKIERLDAWVDNNAKSPGSSLSIDYFVDGFTQNLKFKPHHYYSKAKSLDFYIWHYDNYSLMITYKKEDAHNKNGGLMFSVFPDTTGTIGLKEMGQIIEITQ